MKDRAEIDHYKTATKQNKSHAMGCSREGIGKINPALHQIRKREFIKHVGDAFMWIKTKKQNKTNT